MAPIKFEEKLKDKLEKRSLQPSVDSWSKLSERLEAEERKSKKPWFWWMGIAAGLVIMITLAVQNFGSENNGNTTPQIVKEDVIEQSVDSKQQNINEVEATELALEDENVKDQKLLDEATKEKSQLIDYKSVIKNNPKSKEQLVNLNDVKVNEIEESNELNKAQEVLIEESLIDKKAVTQLINDVISQKTSVTDREVDSLLKLASKELFKDKLKNETGKTVDASSLLLEVEEEMGQSFRTKVYEVLKESYETVKTAVAERKN